MTILPTVGCVESNIKQGMYNQSFEDRSNHVQVQVSLDIPLTYGSCYQLSEVREITNSNFNNSSFNYRQYMKTKMIIYEGTATKLTGQNTGLVLQIKNWRNYLITKNNQLLGTVSPYVNAILLGVNDIPDYYKVLYGQVGIAPLFAISGMHISLVYGGLMYLLARVRVVDKTADKLIFIFLLVYSILAGSSVAINRALMMIGLKHLLKLNSKHAIIISAIISLLINPFNLLNQGYYLSYIITYGIITMPQALYKNQKYAVLKFGYLLYLIALPLSYNFNYTFNLLAPISLLIVTPLITCGLMPLSLIGMIYPNYFVVKLIELIVAVINKYVDFANLVTITGGHINLAMWIIYCLFLYAIFYKLQVKRVIVPLVIWFGLVSLDIELNPQITFIDVGQGDSALVEVDGKNILFDVGNSPVSVRQELKYQGVGKIDAIFISHSHLDHYGSLSALTNYFPIAAIYEVEGNQIINGSTGLDSYFHSDELTIIPYYGTDENNRELIVRLNIHGTSILFPGDIEAESEKYLVNNFCSQINSDIIKVPHHGSKTSSSPDFLSCVSPDYAVISSGRNNRYGHPNHEVVSRYQQISQLYDTQDDGEIVIKIKSQGISIKKVH